MADAATTRRRLIAELRRLRSLAQFNQRQVADALDWSPSKIHRIEKGDVSISVTDLRALLGFYGVTDRGTVGELVQLAKESRKQPLPFSAFRDIFPPDLIRYLGYERAARSLAEVQLLVVPGLLQTEEYARALIGGVHGFDEQKTERYVESRRERQRLLTARDAPEMTFLIDESVLGRLIGGPAVMRAQLRWISQLADLPNVDIRILPLALGAHAGLRGPFVLLTFPGANDPDVLYVEQRRGDSLFRDEPEIIDRHRAHVKELSAVAAAPHDLLVFVQRALGAMEWSPPATASGGPHS